jgi:hypothetical protein
LEGKIARFFVGWGVVGGGLSTVQPPFRGETYTKPAAKFAKSSTADLDRARLEDLAEVIRWTPAGRSAPTGFGEEASF